MSRNDRTLLDSVGDAASDAGSEALAAISNLGGGDAGGTVGRVVSAVFGKHGGFAPKVITSVTKHGIAGIKRVEPLEGVDRGYRAVAADANGLESIRTIIELDPREYEVTVTREEGAGVVEFVQVPEPEPEVEASEPAVEPKPPVTQSGASRADASRDERAQSAVGQRAAAGRGRPGAEVPVETASVRDDHGTQRGSVAQAKAEAEKAKAEAEAEKARAEAETARAEAEAAKARARAEQARANAEAEAIGADPTETPELDGGTGVADGRSGTATHTQAGGAPAIDATAGEQRSPDTSTSKQRDSETASGEQADAGDVDPAFSVPTGVTDEVESPRTDTEPTTATESERESSKSGSTGRAGAASVSSVTAVESAAVDDADDEEVTVDEEFGSFVAASPVEESGDGSADGATDDSLPAETGGFEF